MVFTSSARCWDKRLHKVCSSCSAVIWALFVFCGGASYAMVLLKSMRFAWAIGQFLAQCLMLPHLKHGHHFLASNTVWWFACLLFGCQQIILALGRSHLILYFGGSRFFLCPLGQGSCSNCEVHLRSYIIGFLLG